MILVVFGSFAVHLEKENMPTESIFLNSLTEWQSKWCGFNSK
jgi:hypothetical protein